MTKNIFHLDWVTVDLIIIIFLFFLLMSVKIFKFTHRWRLRYSNEALKYYFFPKANENENNQFVKVKHSYLIKNCFKRKESNIFPLILILRDNFKKKLIHTLSEGLSSFGFNVINTKVKIKKNLNYNVLNEIFSEEFNSIMLNIINYFQNKKLTTQSNFIFLNYSKSSFSYHNFLANSNNLGLININPKLNKINIENYQNLFDNSIYYSKLYTIFNKKSIFIFKNKNLKIFLREFKKYKTEEINMITLGKANKTFKYYETLLLTIIIDLIEDKIINYKRKTFIDETQ